MNNSKNENIDVSKLSSEQLNKISEQVKQQLTENEKKENDQKEAAANEQPKLSPFEDTLQEIRRKDAEQQAIIEEQERKYEKMLTGRDIVVYPKISVSLDEFRREEAAKVNKFGKNSAFVDLFEDRIEKIPGEWDFVAITPLVTIQTGLIEENRTFGPFEMEIPKLDRHDMYKFIMYTLLVNNFSLQSAQVITKIGAKVLTHKKQFFREHFMEGVKLDSHLLSKHRKIKTHGTNTCVEDFIWDQVKGKPGFRSYTFEKLSSEVHSYATIDVMGHLKPKLCTENIITWAKECHPRVAIHAYDATYIKFVTYSNGHPDAILVFIVKDHHCYPITDETLKKVASKANQGGAQNLLKYMIEVKWSRRNENVCKLGSIEEVATHGRENSVIILPKDAKMQEAAKIYVDKSNYYIEYLHWNNNGILDGFMDDKNNMYLLNDNYDNRETVCRSMFEKYQTDDFVWSNQSFAKMATSMFHQISGKLQESTYNVHTQRILDDYSPRALQWCSTGKIPENLFNFDICKCYPSVLLNNEYRIPVYDIHDVIVPFKGKDELDKIGEFYIDETVVYISGAPIKLEAAFYNSDLVRFLVQDLKMPLSKIKYQVTTKRSLSPDTFKRPIKYFFDSFAESEAKILANSFIGELGRKYNKTNTGFTSIDYDTAMCCWTRAMAEGRNLSIDEYNGLFLIKEQHCERLFSDNTSVNRFVISQSILQLLQLIQATVGKKSKLVAYNTDGIFVTNPMIEFPHKKTVQFETKNIGKAYRTDSKLVYFEKKYRENLDFDSYDKVTGTGQIINGQARSGKTTLLCKMVSETEKPLVLAFTNKAIENVKRRLRKTENNKHDPDKICHTFDSYFCEWNEDNFKELKNKTIFVEEFSMVPNKWMTLIYEAFVKYNVEVNLFGDPNQCEPIEGESLINYNYIESETIRQMCPNQKTLPYIEESCRYDRETHMMLGTLLKHGKVSAYFEPIGKYNKNICYLNSTRKSVNESCCERFTEGKDFVTVQFRYNGGRESYKVCVGMPLLATQNLKDDEIFNTMEFKLQDIRRKGEHEFKVNGKWYGLSVFANSFIPAFCVTVYKFQGCDIDEHYNIFDTRLMDKKQIYTALSRTTKFKYIHLNNRELCHRYFIREHPDEEISKTNYDLKYNDGKIYKITFSNGKVYVGSTCEDLKTRLKSHLSDTKSQVYKYSKYKPKIEHIVKALTFDKKKLEEIECKWIERYAEDCGDRLLNIRGNTSRKRSQRKTVVHEVVMESDKQLIARVEQLEGKIVIKDNSDIRQWFYDTVVNGKRYKTMARYKDGSKEAAFERISAKKKQLIKELTVEW